MKKNKKLKRLCILSSGLLLLSGYFAVAPLSIHEQKAITPGVNFQIDQQNGIKIVKYGAAIGYTSDKEVQRFEYEIAPADATTPEIFAEIHFADGTDCSNFVTVNVYNDIKTVDVVCSKPFNKQINLYLRSLTNPYETYTKIKVNYRKKVLSIDPITIVHKALMPSQELFTEAYGDEDILKMDPLTLSSQTYSDFSYDCEYQFKAEILNISNIRPMEIPTNSYFTKYVNEHVNNYVNLLKNKLNETNTYPTINDIWDMYDSTNNDTKLKHWRSSIDRNKDDQIIGSCDVTFRISCTTENANVDPLEATYTNIAIGLPKREQFRSLIIPMLGIRGPSDVVI